MSDITNNNNNDHVRKYVDHKVDSINAVMHDRIFGAVSKPEGNRM